MLLSLWLILCVGLLLVLGKSPPLIFIAGDKGQRILAPNTSILSHQYSWVRLVKNMNCLQIKEFDLTTKRMIAHYKKCTGLKDEIQNFCNCLIQEICYEFTDCWKTEVDEGSEERLFV